MSLVGRHARAAPIRRGKPIPGLRARHTAQFLAELSDLLEAGCQLNRALQVMEQQTAHPALRQLVERLHADIVEGASLADAMAALHGHFGEVDVAMVEAAEAGGFLQRTLRDMAEHSQRHIQMMQQIRAALTYPAILMTLSLASIVFLLNFLVPRFNRIYDTARAALPLPTQILIGASDFLTHYWWACLLGVAGAVLLARGAMRNHAFALRVDAAIFRLPLFGPLARDWAMSQLTRTMSLLLGGGLPALRCLTLTGQVMGNRALREQVSRLAEAVERGEPIGQQMRTSRLFSSSLAELISIGEESGKLPDVLTRLAQQHQRRFATRLAGMLSLVEPTIILVMGVLIGLVVAAMLLPVLLMSTLVG
jgi:general secretion pathway protein F